MKIEKGNICVNIDDDEERISIKFPTGVGEGTLVYNMDEGRKRVYKILLDGEEKASFHNLFPLYEMGSSKRNKLFKILEAEFNDLCIIPKYPDGSGVKGLGFDIERIALDLEQAETNWISKEGRKEENPKISWVIAENRKEHFTMEQINEGRNIFEGIKIIDKALDVAELIAVAQRPKMALFLICSLSSFLPKPIHSILTAPPGKSKSTLSDAIFELFPNHLKMEIGKGSTEASLYNLTKFKEGPDIFIDKLCRLGDWGSKKEQEEYAQVQYVFKELMSEGHISRNITVKDENDENITRQMVIGGVGSIFYTSIEDDDKTEVSSRSITYSPDDNPAVNKAIREYLLDDLLSIESKKEFKRRRPGIAVSISLLYDELQLYKKRYEDFQIFNPFANHMDKIFEIAQSNNEFRDINHIKTLPKVITMACLKKRKIWVNKENNGIMVVTPKDYLYTLKIIEEPILVMISNIPSAIRAYSNTIEEHYVAPFLDKGGTLMALEYLDEQDSLTVGEDREWYDIVKDYPTFTSSDVRAIEGTSNAQVNKMLREMIKVGALFRRMIGKAYVYYPTDIWEDYDPLNSILIHKDEDLDIDSEMGREVTEIYFRELERLKKLGYKVAD